MIQGLSRLAAVVALLSFAAASPCQTSPAGPGAYQPKYAGDKARSEPEFLALGYMRTLVTAQKLYNRKHGEYAPSLMALVGSGSFTRRMASPDRGDYTASFKPKPNGYTLALTPRQFDAAHRAFFVDESGVIRSEDNKAATINSAPLK